MRRSIDGKRLGLAFGAVAAVTALDLLTAVESQTEPRDVDRRAA